MGTFIGRRNEMDLLSRKCLNSNLVIVHGLKSVGKSSLVKQFCNSAQSKTIWNDLKNTTSVEQLVQSLALQILNNIPEYDNFEELLLCVQNEIVQQDVDIIIVFDNAEETLTPEMEEETTKLLDTLAQIVNVKLILTSTIKPVNIDYAEFLFLKPLSFIEARELIISECPSLRDSEHTNKIVELCEGLPLALKLTGAELDDENNPLTPEDMVELLMNCRLQVFSQEMYPREERIKPLYTGSLQRLAESLKEKLAVINYIPGSFNELQVQQLLDCSKGDCEEMLTLSVQRNVIEYDNPTKRFNIHGLLRECISEYLKIKDLPRVRLRYCRIFSKLLEEIQELANTQHYSEALCRINLEQQNFRKLFADVIHCTEDSYHVFVHMAATTLSQGTILFTTLQTYDSGMLFFEQCLKKTEEMKNELDESKVLTGYARIITNIKGDNKLGEIKYREAMAIRNGLETEPDYFKASLYQGLGWNVGNQGRFAEGLEYLEEAYETQVHLRMYNETLILQTMQSLALYHNVLGNLAIGEKFQLETLRRRRQVLGTDNHPIIGSIMNNMGLMYDKMGDLQKAEEFFKRGLEIKLNTKASVQSLIISETNVANCLSARGKFNEALQLMESSIERLDNYQGMYQDKRSLIFESIGRAYMKNNNFVKAERAFKNSIQQRLGTCSQDPIIMGLYALHAESYMSLNMIAKAVNELNKALLLKQALIENIPTCLFAIDSYEMLMEAHFTLKHKCEVRKAYMDCKEDLIRQVWFFEEKRNFEGRRQVSERLHKLNLRYQEMMELFDENISTKESYFFRTSLFVFKIVCTALLIRNLKHR